MYKPYTYLIAWTHLNVFYYGVRYSKEIEGKTPEQDLWVNYFTSSKEVQKFREEYGEPDRIEVRRVFDLAEKSREWETRVLKRVEAVEKDNWLNKSYSDGKWYNRGGYNHTEETKKKISEGNKNKRCSAESRRKISESKKGKKLREETKKKMSESSKGQIPWIKGRKHREESRMKMSESSKGKIAWNRGKKHSEDTLMKISESLKGQIPWNKGEKLDMKTRKKMSESAKGRKWFTNGKKSILLKPTDLVPQGFSPGRKLEAIAA